MKRTGENAGLKFFWLGIFAIAMGALEAIVVVYLRQIYYPSGFDFPMPLLPKAMIATEWFREFTTIVMLAAAGIIAGRSSMRRFAWFLYTFAVWDIFYYVWLKVLLNWPPSLLTWDVLFLIPVPWVSPVLAPLICSVTMVLISIRIIMLEEKGLIVKIRWFEWISVLSGAGIILFTFLRDYAGIIIRGGFLPDFLRLTENRGFTEIITRFIPARYSWLTFVAGEIIIISAFMIAFIRVKTKR